MSCQLELEKCSNGYAAVGDTDFRDNENFTGWGRCHERNNINLWEIGR